MRWPWHSSNRPALSARALSGWPRPAVAALWQAPLIGLLALEIGAALMLFWAAGLAISMLTSRWQRWYAQLILILLLIGMAALTMPVRSADFFITLLVGVLPLTWQLEGEMGRARLSPAGLTPTIFLVGSVFLFQIQFFVLLAVVAWLLAFLLWYCMALTGFRLEALTLRWLPVLMISAGVAGLIVLLFIAVPRLSTGFIPGFATQQKIALSDHIAPGGMRDLLADDSIAFRAVPQQQADPTPRYWRVFILDRERNGEWRRGGSAAGRGARSYAGLEAEHSYLLLLDDHDPAMLPSPDWPRGFSQDYTYSRHGELMTGTRANPRRVIVGGGRDAASGATGGTPFGQQPAACRMGPVGAVGAASDRDFVDLLMRRFAGNFSYETKLIFPGRTLSTVSFSKAGPATAPISRPRWRRASGRRYRGEHRDGLSRRDLERLWRLLDGAQCRRACLGRGAA